VVTISLILLRIHVLNLVQFKQEIYFNIFVTHLFILIKFTYRGRN